MSYAYLFKYIIIGDTGKAFSKVIKIFNLKFRCRQILSIVAIHWQEIQTITWSDYRSRIRSKNNLNQQQEHQAIDLGHSKNNGSLIPFNRLDRKASKALPGLTTEALPVHYSFTISQGRSLNHFLSSYWA